MKTSKTVSTLAIALCLSSFSLVLSSAFVEPASAGESARKVPKPDGNFGRQILVLDEPVLVPDYIFAERIADGSTEERAILDFRGRVVVLNFWATWCGVCARELPKLDELAGSLPASGIDILALSLDEEIKVAAGTLKKRGHNKLRIFQDSQSILSAILGVRGVPTTFVVRPDGYAVAMVQGPADWSSPEALAWLRAFVPPEKTTPIISSTAPAASALNTPGVR